MLFCQIETELGNNLLAIFWIVYLFIKNSKEIEFDDIIEISEMLFALLANVFTYFIASVPMDIIAATVAAEFPSTPLPCVNKLNFYQKIFQDKLQGTHERRYEGTSMNIKLLA